MIVRKFVVRHPDEIERWIKTELGPNAMLLTTREISIGGNQLSQIECVAAVDEEDLKLFLHQKETTQSNLTHVFSDLKRIKKELMGRFNGNEEASFSTRLLQLDTHFLEKELDKLEPLPTVNFPELELLMAKGVEFSVAEKIHLKLFKHLGLKGIQNQELLLDGLKKEISSLILTTGPICLSTEVTPVAIVGPAGVGKTTTLVKIALEYIHDLNTKVVLFSLDSHTIGAFEQTALLAKHFNVPFVPIHHPEELKEEIEKWRNYDLILIDTFGCIPSQTDLMQELEEYLSEIENVQIHLAISAATKDVDVLNLIKGFSRFLPESLIVTKLDETQSLGFILNLCFHTHIAISYLSNGPYIPDQLQVADSDLLAAHFV